MKCKTCKVDKSDEEFPVARNHKSGRGYSCKECRSAYYREFYKENRERIREVVRKRKDRDPEGTKTKSFYYRLKHRYGLSEEDFKDLLRSQGSGCAICKVPFDTTPRVDHCHESEEIRGLLCTGCNVALGGFKDSIQNLAEAIKYLEKFQKTS